MKFNKDSQLLLASVSGVRGVVGPWLTPHIAASYAAAFGTMLKKGPVILGRDSRPSGEMFTRAVSAGLMSVGIDVIDIGIVPTPTVEMAIPWLKANGGICITASHNPSEWNALKFFSKRGEFITPKQFAALSKIYKSRTYAFQPHNKIGSASAQTGLVERHIKAVLSAPAVNRTAIRRARLRVVVDAINGAGSIALPMLLEQLGVKVIKVNCDGSGNFVHTPEPTPANLRQLATLVAEHKADLGLACDPDADRLALVDERGKPVSEEFTLSLAVQQVLVHRKGPVVINLSTSSTTADVAKATGAKVSYAKVGEANVVEMMHARRAVIGGEGNGGVIYPTCHAGRDGLVAAALVLSRLAEAREPLSGLVNNLPAYYLIKDKAPRPKDFGDRLARFAREAARLLGDTRVDDRDGYRFDFADGWVQIRASNTEPIYRLIVETSSPAQSRTLVQKVRAYFS